MDSSQAPDMTLSLGSSAANTAVHRGACLKGKLCHGQLAQCDARNYSARSKRKREKDDMPVSTEVSGLTFEDGNGVKVLAAVELCRSSSNPCISRGSEEAQGTMLMRGVTEEGPSVGLVLGPAGPKSHFVVDGSVTSMAVNDIADPSDRGSEGLTKTTPKQTGNVTDIVLRLGPSHCHPISRDSILKGLDAISDSQTDKDLGIQLQLSLSNSSTVTTDDDCLSHMSLRHVSGSTYPDARNGSVWDEISITAYDEGSTSRHAVKTRRHVPLLEFGGRDRVSLLEGDGLYRDQPKFPHEGPNLWCDNKSNKSNEPSGNVHIASRNVVDVELLSTIERTPNACKFQSCSESARGTSGLCITHGCGRWCPQQGCNRAAEWCTLYCELHGRGSRCQSSGCTNGTEEDTKERMEYCIGDDGVCRSSQDGFTKAARGCSGLFIKHGGGKECQDACTTSAEGYSGLDMSHGVERCCQTPEGSEGGQGRMSFSKVHDCGKRCMIQGCTRSAEGNSSLCNGDGGGKRCIFEGGRICTKSVHVGCVAHCEGKRRAIEGCTTTGRGETSYCVRHGGGKSCRKSSQGSADFCKTHGGKRCCWGQEEFVHDKSQELFTGLRDPLARGKSELCAAHDAFVLDQRVHGADVIGSSFRAGIDPDLFKGLAMNTLTENSAKTELASKHSSLESTQFSEQCSKHGPDIRTGLDSFKRWSGSGNTSSWVRGQSVGYKTGFKFEGTHPITAQNQIQSPELISNIKALKNRYMPASHVLNNCKPNQTIYMRGGSHGAKYFTGRAASTTGISLSSRERHVLLPSQVLVPPSMRNGQFLQIHGSGNIKHSRTGYEGESGDSNFEFLSTGKARVPSGGEERVHGGRMLMSSSGKNSEVAS